MEGSVESYAAHVARDPANRTLESLKAIELYPDEFAECRPFDELDFATFWGCVEDPDTEPQAAGSPNANIGFKRGPKSTAPSFWADPVGIHFWTLTGTASLFPPVMDRSQFILEIRCLSRS
jgi:hypothetical protein